MSDVFLFKFTAQNEAAFKIVKAEIEKAVRADDEPVNYMYKLLWEYLAAASVTI